MAENTEAAAAAAAAAATATEGTGAGEAAPPAPPAPEESKKSGSSWADIEDEEAAAPAAEADKGVEEITKAIHNLDTDISASVPDLHSGELMVREAGVGEGQEQTKPVSSFSSLNIDDDLKKSIAEVKGWQTMSKIQQIGLPLILKDPPLNVIGQAQAGTGKTGTFVVSMLARITPEKKLSRPQGIILCVSQELCTQIAKEVNDLGRFKGISARRIMSARSKHGQASGPAPWELKEGEDFEEQVVVGTVGMVKNYLNNAKGMKKRKPMIDASDTRILILDEADKMVEAPPHGFRDGVVEIKNLVLAKRKKKPCQILLFSATFAPHVRVEAQQYVGGPSNDQSKYHEITLRKEDQTLDKVVNFYHLVGDDNERDIGKIYELKFHAITEIWRELANYGMDQLVIFCNQKATVQRLRDYLKAEGYNAGQIHGDMPKVDRDRVLEEFKTGQRTALVSTNVTSRGIDNPNVTLVINVDLPQTVTGDADPENFVHRIGRSGRWTKKGASVSLVARSNMVPDLAIMQEINNKLFANENVERPLIAVEKIENLGEAFKNSLEAIN